MEQSKGFELLQACAELRRQLGVLLSQGELTQGEYLVLKRLSAANRPETNSGLADSLRAARLSDDLDIKRPMISRILKSLEERRFISRAIDESNRRSFELKLTEAGKTALMKADHNLSNIAQKLQDSLGEEDTGRLIELVRRATDVYRQMSAERQAGDND